MSEEEIKRMLAAHLHYSFNNIGWRFNELTDEERAIFETAENFEHVRRWSINAAFGVPYVD